MQLVGRERRGGSEDSMGAEKGEQIFHYKYDIYKYHSLWVRLHLS